MLRKLRPFARLTGFLLRRQRDQTAHAFTPVRQRDGSSASAFCDGHGGGCDTLTELAPVGEIRDSRVSGDSVS